MTDDITYLHDLWNYVEKNDTKALDALLNNSVDLGNALNNKESIYSRMDLLIMQSIADDYHSVLLQLIENDLIKSKLTDANKSDLLLDVIFLSYENSPKLKMNTFQYLVDHFGEEIKPDSDTALKILITCINNGLPKSSLNKLLNNQYLIDAIRLLDYSDQKWLVQEAELQLSYYENKNTLVINNEIVEKLKTFFNSIENYNFNQDVNQTGSYADNLSSFQSVITNSNDNDTDTDTDNDTDNVSNIENNPSLSESVNITINSNNTVETKKMSPQELLVKFDDLSSGKINNGLSSLATSLKNTNSRIADIIKEVNEIKENLCNVKRTDIEVLINYLFNKLHENNKDDFCLVLNNEAPFVKYSLDFTNSTTRYLSQKRFELDENYNTPFEIADCKKKVASWTFLSSNTINSENGKIDAAAELIGLLNTYDEQCHE